MKSTAGKQQPAHCSMFPRGTCLRCCKTDHVAKDCRFKEKECQFCKKNRHIESVCLQKKTKPNVEHILAKPLRVINHINSQNPICQPLKLNSKPFVFEVDTGSPDTFCSKDTWTTLGRPKLQPAHSHYIAANGKPLPVLGRFHVNAFLDSPA